MEEPRNGLPSTPWYMLPAVEEQGGAGGTWEPKPSGLLERVVRGVVVDLVYVFVILIILLVGVFGLFKMFENPISSVRKAIR